MEERTPAAKVSVKGIFISTVPGSILLGAAILGVVFLFSAAFNFGWQTKLDPKTRDSNWTGGGLHSLPAEVLYLRDQSTPAETRVVWPMNVAGAVIYVLRYKN